MMEKLLLFGELGRGTAIRNVAPDLWELVTIKTKMLQMVKQTLHQEQWIRGIISLLSVQA